MWFLIQSLIIFAVVGSSNIHWQWTPNGYLAGLIGVALAYGATVLLGYLTSLFKTKRTYSASHSLTQILANYLRVLSFSLAGS